MKELPHRYLTTLTLTVDFRSIASIGSTPHGLRGIAPITAGRFEGPLLNGRVLSGSDWFINRADGNLAIDVRLTLETHDNALIYLSYKGRMTADADAMARFRRGERLDEDEYSLSVVANFECGDERYRWLNDAIAVAVGEQTPDGPVYTIYEVNG
ncbi:MAG: DUF3237 domain-containing protein [Pseudomonadota bacterium]